MTHYDVLGVGPEADDLELRRAYRAALRRWHPDLSHHPESHQRLAEVLCAGEVLRDPAQRAAYDASLSRRAAAGVVFVRRDRLWRRVWRWLRPHPRRSLR